MNFLPAAPGRLASKAALSLLAAASLTFPLGCASGTHVTSSSEKPPLSVNGQPVTVQQMADAVITLSRDIADLRSQLATDEQTIQQMRTALTAVGNRAGCGYQDLGPDVPMCPQP